MSHSDTQWFQDYCQSLHAAAGNGTWADCLDLMSQMIVRVGVVMARTIRDRDQQIENLKCLAESATQKQAKDRCPFCGDLAMAIAGFSQDKVIGCNNGHAFPPDKAVTLDEYERSTVPF